jgi:transposase-like protein
MFDIFKEIDSIRVCPLCASTKLRISGFYHGLNLLYKCNDCNTVFLEHTPLENDLIRSEARTSGGVTV